MSGDSCDPSDRKFTLVKKISNVFILSPGLLFLHGTVALGFNKVDGSSGPAGFNSRKTYGYWDPIQLLYPVSKKDYNSDTYIKNQWHWLAEELKEAKRVTIFGYSAPDSDVEAIKLLKAVWGTPSQRNLEQFELIDLREKDEVKKSWRGFIHSHHYDYCTSFFKSSIAMHPRRSVESYMHWAFPSKPSEAFQEGNPVPQDVKSLKELWDWYKPLIQAENTYFKRLGDIEIAGLIIKKKTKSTRKT